MLKKVLLLTTYSNSDAVVICVTRFKIDKLLLLTDNNPSDIQTKVLTKIREMFGGFIEIEAPVIPRYDLYTIVKTTLNLLKKHNNDYEILINVSGGKKTQALGVIYAASVLPDAVKKIIYVIEETNEIIELPVFSFNLSKIKTTILKKIADGYKVPKIAEELNISKSMVYSHIRDMRKKRFLDQKNNLTLAGRIIIEEGMNYSSN